MFGGVTLTTTLIEPRSTVSRATLAECRRANKVSQIMNDQESLVTEDSSLNLESEAYSNGLEGEEEFALVSSSEDALESKSLLGDGI